MAFDLKTFLTSGSGPTISGDPVTALTNQVNRFNKAYGKPALAATPGAVGEDLAVQALGIRQAQLTEAVVAFPNDSNVAAQLSTVAAAFAQPVAYVTSNLTSLTQQIQLYADSKFGSKWSPFTWALIASGTLLAATAGVRAYKHRRALRAG